MNSIRVFLCVSAALLFSTMMSAMNNEEIYGGMGGNFNPYQESLTAVKEPSIVDRFANEHHFDLLFGNYGHNSALANRLQKIIETSENLKADLTKFIEKYLSNQSEKERKEFSDFWKKRVANLPAADLTKLEKNAVRNGL